jgi:hypothetical protein
MKKRSMLGAKPYSVSAVVTILYTRRRSARI